MMRRARFLPSESWQWYLRRGFVAGLACGLFLGGAMMCFLALMSGGGTNAEMWLDELGNLILPILGWGVIGAAAGLVAWLLSRGFARMR